MRNKACLDCNLSACLRIHTSAHTLATSFATLVNENWRTINLVKLIDMCAKVFN